MQIKKIILDEIESTNSYAKTLNDYQPDTLTVIRAKRQTGGRGRLDKSFFSDHSGGLWVSLVVGVDDIGKHFLHNRAISLAIVSALKKSCLNHDGIKIKWPNDIYWDDKKIAGILLENVLVDSGCDSNFIVVGFGLNVNMGLDDFPDELKDVVSSVFIKSGKNLDLDLLLDDIVSAYKKNICEDVTNCHYEYSNLLYRINHQAKIGDDVGVFDGVEVDGRLRLKINDDETKFFTSGTLEF